MSEEKLNELVINSLSCTDVDGGVEVKPNKSFTNFVDFVFPEQIDGKDIVSVSGFSNYTNFETIILPNTLKQIKKKMEHLLQEEFYTCYLI